MTGWGKKRGGFSAILILLLACLCFSRGEGIRLLPFAEKVVPTIGATASHNTAAIPRVSERMEAPIERKADCNLVKNLAKHLVSVDVPSVTQRASGVHDPTLPVFGTSAWNGPSKFGLTSSSDRSPPSAGPIV